MAPQAGLEPATTRLTAECSTIELLRNDKNYMVERTGFEPVKVKTSRFTVCPLWPAREPLRGFKDGGADGIRTRVLLRDRQAC